MLETIEMRYRQLSAEGAHRTEAGNSMRLLDFARLARRAARTDLAILLLEQHLQIHPNDHRIAFAHAQLRYESGLPSADLFAALLHEAPDDLRLVAALASAQAAAAMSSQAEALLLAALAAYPGWIDGHKSLAALRWTMGAPLGTFSDSFAVACAQQPKNRALWLAWFHIMAQAKAWDRAKSIIADAERRMGTHIAFTLARLYIASESGDDASAEPLFAATATLLDPGLELCRIRYGLRRGTLDWAEAAALRLLKSPAAKSAWPYLSLVWRLKNDPRAAWLDAPDETIRAFDLALSAQEISELATLLRSLHTAQAPRLDQSVRGGTQTDRPLFFRHEPIITTLKTKILAAIDTYFSLLPAFDSAHPLCSEPRAGIMFAGSWSVRLLAEGFHVAHTHPMGMLSSAFYVALPPPTEHDAPAAGWISFGTPPPELGLSLAPYTRIEPNLGRLVLFPSTMWHSTEPFAAGERLVVAFDVVPDIESV